MHLLPSKHHGSELRNVENEFSKLQNEMNSLMNNFFTKWEPSSSFEEDFFPEFDLMEKDNQYIVDMEVPGLENKDINIDIRNNTLTVKGEKRNESKRILCSITR